jgi:hypothetical protein
MVLSGSESTAKMNADEGKQLAATVIQRKYHIYSTKRLYGLGGSKLVREADLNQKILLVSPSYRLSNEYVLTHRQNLAAFVGTTSSIHYYESIVLIEKLSVYVKRPVPIKPGTRNIPYTSNTPFSSAAYDFSQIEGLSTLGIVM